jgi:hypothetical protein
VKPLALLLSGVAAMAAGASLLSCEPDTATILANSWCGKMASLSSLANHPHCAGCALAAMGVVLIAASPLLAIHARVRGKAST